MSQQEGRLMVRRLLWIALAAGLVCSSLAERHAILIGIDKYSFITAPTQQLRGAKTDVDMMRRMLDFYGFKSVTLLRSEATRAKIIAALDAVDKAAKSGDEAVFYFSGRGSIAPKMETPNAKVEMEPTLAPYDAVAANSGIDLRMRRIEDWAKQLDTRGVNVSIVLDCSFQSPTRSDFGRQYHPVPRSIARTSTAAGEARSQVFEGPGAVLTACPARGAAYEWLQNSTEGRWSGAFTDQLVNSVVAALNRGENPSYVDAMREAQAYFKDKVRADYMPGLAPQPSMPTLIESPDYGVEAFGGLDVSKLPADSKAAIAAQARIQAERERKFRVGVEVLEPTEEKSRTEAARKASEELKNFVAQRLPNSEFAPAGAPPDVVVQIRAEKGKLSAEVTGDDLDKSKVFTFAGKDMRAALNGGLGDYLELRSLVSRLYKISATETPTWGASVQMTADPIALSRGEEFDLEVASDREAILFILNRDDADGVLQIAFPQPNAPFQQRISAKVSTSAMVENDSSNGRMMFRAILVPASGGVRIPDVDMKDPAKFRASLIRQLRVVVPAIEQKKLEWVSKTINLRIR
jgi:hypothetical protein